MKDTPLSNVEREFLIAALKTGKRIDGRDTYDYRNIKISFGLERGCCEVQLGDTRVLAQVSCDTIEPKNARPTEGQLFLNLELSPMASPAFEPGRLSDYGVELNRLLERCLKQSRAVDMESLCIVAGEKVWQIRVDVHVLNHDGSILDCASIAAISALSHFRRPDVTVVGESVTIHSPEERDPVPLSVHHMPICATFAFFEQGKYLLVDPSFKEECVMEGNMVIAMNAHREICTVQMTGGMLLLKDQILRCSQIAVIKVAEIIALIKKALANDTKARSEGKQCGYAESMPRRRITTSVAQPQEVDTSKSMETAQEVVARTDAVQDADVDMPTVIESGLASLGEGTSNTWLIPGNEDELAEDDVGEEEEAEQGDAGMEVEAREEETVCDDTTKSKSATTKTKGTRGTPSDSEEEETVTLTEEDLSGMKRSADVSTGLDLSVALKTSESGHAPVEGHPSKKRNKRKGKKK